MALFTRQFNYNNISEYHLKGSGLSTLLSQMFLAQLYLYLR